MHALPGSANLTRFLILALTHLFAMASSGGAYGTKAKDTDFRKKWDKEEYAEKAKKKDEEERERMKENEERLKQGASVRGTVVLRWCSTDIR